MHKMTVKDHADLRNDAVLLREDEPNNFDSITWLRDPDHICHIDAEPSDAIREARNIAHEPLSDRACAYMRPMSPDEIAQHDLANADKIRNAWNPDHVGGIEPGLRQYGKEPLGAHPSDNRPKPDYWDSSGVDRVNSEFNGLVWHVVGYVSASLLGIYLAMLWLNINPLELL